MRSTCVDNAVTTMKGTLISKLHSENLTVASGPEGSEFKGPIFVREFQNKFQGVVVKECIPLAKDSHFIGSDWSECECSAYTKILGGKF